MINTKRILFGYMDTRSNNEDMALTPYIGLVWSNNTHCKVFGLSITWIYFSFYVGLGINVPKDYPTFRNIK